VIPSSEYQGISGIPMKINGGTGVYLVRVRVERLSEVFKVVKYRKGVASNKILFDLITLVFFIFTKLL